MTDKWELVHQWTEPHGLEFRLVSRMDPDSRGSAKRKYSLERKSEDRLGNTSWQEVALALLWSKEEDFLSSLYYACLAAKEQP